MAPRRRAAGRHSALTLAPHTRCAQAQRRAERETRDEAKRVAAAMSYETVMQQDAMVTSRELAEKYQSAEDYEDDFM